MAHVNREKREFPLIVVEEVTEIDGDIVAAFDRLIPQLSKSNPPPTLEELKAIADSPATIFLVAREGKTIVGSLTLALFRIPTGLRAWIEDVVVDESARGKGVGRTLSEAALEHARAVGAKTVDLTSRPSREVANRLYQKIGFEKRETNVYRFAL
ncbi:MAG: GNAT family N-acetyltransferase [Acidimicrobiales bacterium]